MQSAQRGPAVLQLNAARKRDSHVQSLKTRLRKNMNAIIENYELILSRAKVDTNESAAILNAYAQAEQDTYEMSVRAGNIQWPHLLEEGIQHLHTGAAVLMWIHRSQMVIDMDVHACENLTRLVSEIKQLLILGDFCWLAMTTTAASEELRKRRADLDRVSVRLRDKLAVDLYAIEEECGTPLVPVPPEGSSSGAPATTGGASTTASALSDALSAAPVLPIIPGTKLK